MAERKGLLGRLLGQKAKPPSVPESLCVFAIGDIHGRVDLLDRLLERLWSAGADDMRHMLIFLGDYVDRGPASRQVIDRLLSLRRPGWDVIALRGNHDQMILNFLEQPEVYRAWREFGGAETLLSYGVRPPAFDREGELLRIHEEFRRALPDAHLRFLQSLPYWHVVGDYLFVHAGLRPGIALEDQAPEDLMWIRDDFLQSERTFPNVVVHGHTPSPRPVVAPGRICVDTGAYATGCLTAVRLEGDECIFLSTGADD